jgi:hypothetical protein
MKRALAGLLLAAAVVLAVPVRHAVAQSPAPAAQESDDDGDARPWGRLFVFIPVSIAIGAAGVYGRRIARDRGWLSS